MTSRNPMNVDTMGDDPECLTLIILVFGIFLIFIGQVIASCWTPVRGWRWLLGLLITLFGLFLLHAAPLVGAGV